MNDWSVPTCRGGSCVSVSLSLSLSFSLIPCLLFSLFLSPVQMDGSGESGKKRAVSAAFHPLSIVAVVLLSSPGRGPRERTIPHAEPPFLHATSRTRETAARSDAHGANSPHVRGRARTRPLPHEEQTHP